MKAKKFNKKLHLNKKTISNLENMEMKRVNGGEPTGILCPIPDTRNCTWGQQYTCDGCSGLMTILCCE